MLKTRWEEWRGGSPVRDLLPLLGPRDVAIITDADQLGLLTDLTVVRRDTSGDPGYDRDRALVALRRVGINVEAGRA